MKIVTAVLAAVLLLAGCSGSSDDAPAPDPTRATDGSTSAAREQAEQQAEQQKAADEQLEEAVGQEAEKQRSQRVAITIKDGKVSPRGERIDVEKGQKITLLVTSDADEEIHVHSDPEHTYQVRAGGSIEKSFTIDTPGQVAVEAHHLDATIVQLVVR